MENYRVISVVYRYFRPGSYFHERDNRLTVTLLPRQTFTKCLFWTNIDAWDKISGKLTSNICCLSFFSSWILFVRETQQADCDVIVTSNVFKICLFRARSNARGLLSGKLPSSICCLLFL